MGMYGDTVLMMYENSNSYAHNINEAFDMVIHEEFSFKDVKEKIHQAIISLIAWVKKIFNNFINLFTNKKKMNDEKLKDQKEKYTEENKEKDEKTIIKLKEPIEYEYYFLDSNVNDIISRFRDVIANTNWANLDNPEEFKKSIELDIKSYNELEDSIKEQRETLSNKESIKCITYEDVEKFEKDLKDMLDKAASSFSVANINKMTNDSTAILTKLDNDVKRLDEMNQEDSKVIIESIQIVIKSIQSVNLTITRFLGYVESCISFDYNIYNDILIKDLQNYFQ